MNVNLEFNSKFDNEDYIITIQSNGKVLSISVEDEDRGVYWKKEYDEKAITDITSQMGSFKSLEVFTKMLICALSNENDTLTINFLSFNEIQKLKNPTASFDFSNPNDENNRKKYFILVYTQFEKVMYPLQLTYYDKTPDTSLLLRTIDRLKKEKKNFSSETHSTNDIVNFNEYERLKKENLALIARIKILESNRPLGAVDNDDIYKRYNELNNEYNEYKMQSDSKIKMLLKSIDDLKETQFRESKSSFNETSKTKAKIADLEPKLQIASDIVSSERKKAQIFIDEKNKQIEVLKKEIKSLKDNEKQLKVKITKLEKDLELANRSSNYYRYGNTTPKSYKTSSVGSHSYMSGFSTGSKKSSTSFLKKNLIPSSTSNPYNKYKGLRSKNYKPFSFMNDKKSHASSSYNKSYKSNSSYKSKGSLSHKSNSTYKSTNSKNSKKSSNKYSNVKSRVFSKPKVNNSKVNVTKKTNTNIQKNTTNAAKVNFNTNNTNTISTTRNLYDSNNIKSRIEKIQELIDHGKAK